MLWEMLCWEMLGLKIRVDVSLTCITAMKICVFFMQLYYFMAVTTFSRIMHFHTLQTNVHIYFEEDDKEFKVSTQLLNFPDLTLIKFPWDVLGKKRKKKYY